jgi:adenine-specific DNA-methyltransferase
MTMLLEAVDFFRLDANRKIDPARRSEFGQFMTPPATAHLMASMFEATGDELSLLDAGAGVGSLTAAFVHEICRRAHKPKKIHATAYEIDSHLAQYLSSTLAQSRATCEEAQVAFEAELLQRDFIEDGVRQLRGELFSPVPRFNCAILNPPYRKINSGSEMRASLRQIGVETSNLYTGFLSVVLMLLAPGGELVAITPRSFCNGPYFKPFRKLLLDLLTIRRVHVFESRQVAFREDEVLQENVIFHGVKGEAKDGKVIISSSTGPEDDFSAIREISCGQLVNEDDPEYFIHIVPDELGASAAEQMGRLYWTLKELEVQVSTGRVVDFRARPLLRAFPDADTAPLIYPSNFEDGFIAWPKSGVRKPQALALLSGAGELLVPNQTYVLVKRFTAKEEGRRVVAAVYDPSRIDSGQVGFENHINYFHCNGGGLPTALSKGLAAFLNSTLVDLYFRQFSGHTQVNAADLRNLKYPSRSQLEALGSKIGNTFPDQEGIDRYVEEALKLEDATHVPAPVKAKKRINEALAILKDLDLPREQQNERSALTLLSLLDVKPHTPWSRAKDPLMGITPMMDYFAAHYGKRYAPNSRETVRRQTIHQFLEAGIVNINPDDSERPTNSPNAVYQIERGLLELLRTFGTPRWKKALETYLSTRQSLRQKYAQERRMKRIPIRLPGHKIISLSPGGQNILVQRIIKDFCELFAGGANLLYVGDTDEKWMHFDEPLLKSLGVTVEAHGKMPDVIVYIAQKNWLLLIEAVTSHGPINPKRQGELKSLFKGCTAGLVFVTAFLDRQAMVRHLGDISWETEVWVADAPTHLIHFNGERFLGPYGD